jgi:hypothetical protein
LQKGTHVPPTILRSKNGFQLKEAEVQEGATGADADRAYYVTGPDNEEVLFESPNRPEAEKAFERLTS